MRGTAKASQADGARLTQVLHSQLPPFADRVSLAGVLKANRPSQRAIRWAFAQRVDLRRTLRWWARSGGTRIRFESAWRPVRPTRLIVLWDVSGSMAESIPLYLPWLYRLAHGSSEVKVFPFGVRVKDLTHGLQGSYSEAVAAASAIPDLWESGTSLGASLKEWDRVHGPRCIRGRTTVAVVSDGWDSGEPERLVEALRSIRARHARIVWIHPLMGTQGFALRTRSLIAAKPFVDAWFAGGTWQELLRIVM